MKAPFVYLIRKRALGDVLWIEPVIRQLAERYKKVIVFSRYNELFANFPLTNVVFKDRLSMLERVLYQLESLFSVPLFTINLDEAYEKNPQMHFLHAYQKKAGLPLTDQYPLIYLSNEEKAAKPVVQEKYAVIHVDNFSAKNYRKVYGVNWDLVVQHLTHCGFTVIQAGRNPLPIAGVRQVVTGNIRDLITLIGKSSLFIGLDSGPSHIAASIGVPSLIFFGAVNPAFRHFKSLFKGYILQQPCEFAGCYHEKRGAEDVVCRLVGDAGIPKCSLHSTEFVTHHVDLLIKEYCL